MNFSARGFHFHLDGIRYTIDEAGEIKRKAKIVKAIMADGIRLDKPVCVDSRRVMRLPMSVNAKTGMVVTPMTREELGRPDWLERIPRIGLPTITERVAAPQRRAETPQTPDLLVLSSIVGTNGRQVVSLRYTTLPPEWRLKELAQRFGLGKFVILKDDFYWAISPKSVEQAQFLKVVEASGCDGDYSSQVSRMGYGWFGRRAERIGAIEGGIRLRGPVSLAHAALIGVKSRNTCGKPTVVERRLGA